MLYHDDRESLIIETAKNHPITCDLTITEDLAIGSYLGVPIITNENKFFGTLCILRNSASVFTNEEVDYVKQYAQFLSQVISLEYLTIHDPLTGLYNRSFLEKLYAKEKLVSFAFIYFDLDRFKFVNDTLGHSAGDVLLQSVVNRIENILNENAYFVRLGGDEFAILLLNTSGRTEIKDFIGKVKQTFIKPFTIHNIDIYSSPSIGVSIYPIDGAYDDLLMYADAAMYKAKESGGNTFHFFSSEMNEKVSTAMLLSNEIPNAIKNSEFELYYQPEYDLKTDKIIALEALIRWKSPKFGFVSPGDFIPVIEDTSLILDIGKWVLYTACMQLKDIASKHPNIRIAVNVSVKQFQHPDFLNTIDEVLEQTKTNPKHIELEITESISILNSEDTIQKLNELKRRDISIALDDFGAGYTSLSYLRHFSVNKLKIDRMFIKDIADDVKQEGILEALIKIANILDIKILGEGIETIEQLDRLKNIGCLYGQGYYYNKPMSYKDLLTLLDLT